MVVVVLVEAEKESLSTLKEANNPQLQPGTILVDEDEFCANVQNLLQRLLGEIALDPALSYKICQLIIEPKYSLRWGTWYRLIKAKIKTNNRSLLLGQVPPFSAGQLEGFYPNYIYGYFDAWLETQYGEEVARCYQLHLDVHQDATMPVYGTSRILEIEEAKLLGVLSEQSLLAEKMRQYQIQFLKIVGSDIVGPTPDMILALESLLPNPSVQSMLDLFCGTGALSKVALKLGVPKILAIDIDTQGVHENLSKQDKCQILQTDIFEWRPTEFFDLAMVDATYSLGLDVSKHFVPTLLSHTSCVIFDVGLKEDGYWIDEVLKELSKYAKIILPLRFTDSIIALVTNNDTWKWNSTHNV